MSPAAPVERIGVVVPVRDGGAAITMLLDALAAQDRVPDALVVVDDASSDDTAARAAGHPSQPGVVRGSGRGSYAARNTGVAALGDPVDAVAFTDVDCRPAPGWLAALATALHDAELVAGRIEQAVADDDPVWARYDAATYLDQAELVRHAGFGATANLAVRRSVFDELGGFDDTLRSSGDLDLGRRAREAGHRLVLAEDAVVVHRPRRTATELFALHRRLGAGWAALADRDGGPSVVADPRLRPSLGHAVERVAAQGPALRRRQLLAPHLVAVAGRVIGRVTGRG